MFCTKCGKMLPDDSKFCSACGNSVSNISAPVHTAQPQGGSVYLRPPQPMQPPQSAPGYRPPVSPMQPPPAAPVYRPPVQPMQPPPAAPVYRPPVQPMQPSPAAPVYQPPVQPIQPPPAAPVYQPPVQPAQPEPVPVKPDVKPEPVVNAPVAEVPVAEPVVAEVPEAVEIPVATEVPEAPVAEPIAAEVPEVAEAPVMEPIVAEELGVTEVPMAEPVVEETPELDEISAQEPVALENVPEYIEGNREQEVFANEMEDIINSEATVSEVYIPAAVPSFDSNAAPAPVRNATITDIPLNESKQQNIFYTEPNVVYCEDDSKAKKSVGKIILKVTSCVLAVIFAITTLLLVNIRLSLTTDNVSAIVDETNVGGLIDECGGQLGEFCIDRISDDDMEVVLSQGPFRNYFKNIANGYVSYIIGGEKPQGISGKNFAKVIESNADLVENVSEYRFKDYEIEIIASSLDDSKELSRICDNDMTSILRFLLSPYTLIGLMLLTLLCFAGIVIFSEDKRKGIRLLGIIIAIIAVFVLAMMFAAKFIIVANIYGELAKVADMLISNAITVSYISCGSMFAVGAILFAVSFIGKKSETV